MNAPHQQVQHEGRSSALPADGIDLRLRVRARLRQRDLDREIAAGASPAGSPLPTRAERHAVAAWFVNILDAAAECDTDPVARVTLNHRAVLAARSEIAQLIERLRDDGAVDVRGVALADCSPTTQPDHSSSRVLARRSSRRSRTPFARCKGRRVNIWTGEPGSLVGTLPSAASIVLIDPQLP